MPPGKRLADFLEEQGLTEEQLRERFLVMHPIDLADYIEDLRVREKAELFGILAPDQAARVFELLPFPSKLHIARWVARDRLVDLMRRFPPDEATDIVMQLSKKRQKEVLEALPDEVRQAIDKLIVFPKHTAGGVMTTRVPRAREKQTVREALDAVRSSNAESVDDIFVIDETGKLRGAVRVLELLRAVPDDLIGPLARPVEHTVRPDLDQEKVARIVERHNLRSIPVVDGDGRLIGVVNLHDILDVFQQESAEDMLKLAGAEEAHPLYDTIGARVRGRMPSILIALVIELALALVIGVFFHQTLEQLILLSAFIPVILASAGGVALQSSTLIVRGLIDGTLGGRHSIAVIFSEMQAGFLISIICGLFAAGAGYVFNIGAETSDLIVLSVSIFAGMVGAITVACLIGAGMPLLLQRMGRDPATSSGPLITACNDLVGATTYLLIAALIQTAGLG